MPTNATGTDGVQLTGNAGAALHGPVLIDVTRLLDNLNNRLLTSAETTTRADLIKAVSGAIRRYCRTDFLPQTYDELYSGNGAQRLLVRQIPDISVQSVRYGPYAVLRIFNYAYSTNQRATVALSTHEVGCYRSPGLLAKRATLGCQPPNSFLPQRGC
jgi:hypothetical protein